MATRSAVLRSSLPRALVGKLTSLPIGNVFYENLCLKTTLLSERAAVIGVFISYQSENDWIARAIQTQLESLPNVKVFCYSVDIEKSVKFPPILESQIAEADWFLALVGPGYFDRRWIQEELNVASRVREDKGRGKPRVLPIRLCKCVDPSLFPGDLSDVNSFTINEIDRLHELINDHMCGVQ